MTNAAWSRGIGELVLAFPDREQSREQAAARADLYRTHLDDLGDEQWAHAVRETIRRERWFPTVAVLREYAAEWTTPVVGYLAPPRRTAEEIEADRATTRRGLDLIRAHVPGIDAKEPLPPVEDRSFPG